MTAEPGAPNLHALTWAGHSARRPVQLQEPRGARWLQKTASMDRSRAIDLCSGVPLFSESRITWPAVLINGHLQTGQLTARPDPPPTDKLDPDPETPEEDEPADPLPDDAPDPAPTAAEAVAAWAKDRRVGCTWHQDSQQSPQKR